MSAHQTPRIGAVGWIDLTVADADKARDFHRDGAGWSVQNVDMGGSSDYCTVPPGADQPVAGVCHARAVNAGLPPYWIIYIVVEDLEEALARCRSLGGEALHRRPAESGGIAVIKDPAGAVCALHQAASRAGGAPAHTIRTRLR